jgi:hypothetical protein
MGLWAISFVFLGLVLVSDLWASLKLVRVIESTHVLSLFITSPTPKEVIETPQYNLYKKEASCSCKSRSRAVSTKRTILSPFTKEYRVRAANSGIRLFLLGFFLWEEPPQISLNLSLLIVGADCFH